jgi:thiamine biosynthesis lipoprotein
MAIILDGIAKGYIIDQGTAVLRELGFDHVMVEIGGDLSASGGVGERPWQVSIQHPQDAASTVVAQLHNGAMATSGDYMNTFTTDRALHHILNPASGVSPGELSSVSVIAPNACDADALATAVIVMGRSSGFQLIEALEGVEALAITKNNLTEHTSNFPLT